MTEKHYVIPAQAGIHREVKHLDLRVFANI